jgi:hypothetical protein
MGVTQKQPSGVASSSINTLKDSDYRFQTVRTKMTIVVTFLCHCVAVACFRLVNIWFLLDLL